jgi:hypothetical protein
MLRGCDPAGDVGPRGPVLRLLDAAREEPEEEAVGVETEQVGHAASQVARVGVQSLVAVQMLERS